MRYEHIVMDLSTAACARLNEVLETYFDTTREGPGDGVYDELLTLSNELRARLQRRDVDPHARQRP